jgi:hypothetical protein
VSFARVTTLASHLCLTCENKRNFVRKIVTIWKKSMRTHIGSALPLFCTRTILSYCVFISFINQYWDWLISITQWSATFNFEISSWNYLLWQIFDGTCRYGNMENYLLILYVMQKRWVLKFERKLRCKEIFFIFKQHSANLKAISQR